jgi:hypothetical protein
MIGSGISFASRVPGGGAWLHLAEGDDLGHRVLAVLVLHVADHPVAAADREVDVDVRHRVALGVQEPLEEQVRRQRVDVGDAQHVAHDRPRRGAAAGTDGDAVVLGVLDEVPDDQEVRLEAHLLDHRQLGLEPLDRRGRGRVAVAAPQALLGEAAQVLRRTRSVRRLVARQQEVAEVELDVAALRDLQRGRHRFRPVAERLRHLGRVLHIELVGVEAELRLGQRRLRLHAQQRGVRRIVLAAQVVHVGRADQRAAQLACDADDLLVRAVLLGDLVVLDLEVDVVGAEHAQQLVRVRARLLRALLDDALAEPRLQAARERDHPLRVAVQQLHVDVGLAAAKALQVAQGGELDQVPEALAIAGQQGQVIALVADLLAVVAVVHEVRLEAQDRLHAVLATGLVELDRAVQHAVIGEPQRRHPELGGTFGQLLDLAGAVEQRVLGVDMQMDGARRAHGATSVGARGDARIGPKPPPTLKSR